MGRAGLTARNGHAALARRIDQLEVVMESTAAEQEAYEATLALWARFPYPLQVYLSQYEVGRDNPSRSMHASIMWDQAALRVDRGDDPLPAVCGWVLRHAWSVLGCWHAIDLRPQRGMTCTDTLTSELAGQELFALDQATLHRMWVDDPEWHEWLRLWREQGSRKPDVLERAGLGDAEIALLDASIEPSI